MWGVGLCHSVSGWAGLWSFAPVFEQEKAAGLWEDKWPSPLWVSVSLLMNPSCICTPVSTHRRAWQIVNWSKKHWQGFNPFVSQWPLEFCSEIRGNGSWKRLRLISYFQTPGDDSPFISWDCLDCVLRPDEASIVCSWVERKSYTGRETLCFKLTFCVQYKLTK